MSKKDFIGLADVLRSTEPQLTEEGFYQTVGEVGTARDAWTVTRDALADFCQSVNPAFNRARWLGYIAGENGSSGGAVKGGAK